MYLSSVAVAGSHLCGSNPVLEELGVLPYLKRFAGASAGSFAGNGNGNVTTIIHNFCRCHFQFQVQQHINIFICSRSFYLQHLCLV